MGQDGGLEVVEDRHRGGVGGVATRDDGDQVVDAAAQLHLHLSVVRGDRIDRACSGAVGSHGALLFRGYSHF